MRDAMADETYSRRGVLRATAGTAAAAALGSAATGAAAAQTDFEGWFTDEAPGGATDNYDGEVVDRTGEDEITVTVGADGNGGTFAFEPAAVRISPGTTVTFEWVSATHNVLVESQPEDAGWEGHEPIENTGFSFSATLDTRGVYKYYCEPHLSVGMKAAIVVGPAPAEDGGGGPAGTTTPFSPLLGMVFAGAVAAAMLLPVLAGYYRRDQPETPEYDDVEGEPGAGTQEAPVEEPVEELDHDEYDPMGTAALVAVYFLILVAMWVFMYFVEFLGNELTVIG